MLGGLYGDLPPPSSTDEDRTTAPSSNVWSSSAKMAPPTLRKPNSVFAPPQTILKPQNKPKTLIPPHPKAISSVHTTVVVTNEGTKNPSFQPALVGVTSTVIEVLLFIPQFTFFVSLL